jgi:hypothetical protein
MNLLVIFKLVFVECLDMGWTTERLEFEPMNGQEFSLHHIYQTGSGVHSTYSPVGTVDCFTGGKVAGA